MATCQAQFPRAVKAAPEPLGWYLRPSYTDHRAIADAVAGGSVGLHGLVFDPLYEDRHSELRQVILERNRDAILDPKTQEPRSKGGFNQRMSALPWALDRPHLPEDFSDMRLRRVVDSIAQYAVEKRYTAVLAPTHYIDSANSAWLEIDARSTGHLRRRLDNAGAKHISIFYSLAVSYETFRTGEDRQLIVERLNDLPIDSLWIKVSQSGTLTHAAVRNLVNGAVDFHSLGMPLVGDMMGGLRERSALAFGAYGGICHGVTQKERFNASSWTRPASSSRSGFTWPPRIYVPSLDIHLKRREAEAFFGAYGSKSRFGCRDKTCCPKGVKDMLDYPVRHSLVQRSGEIQRLSDVPEHLRAQRFIEETVRPTTDAAVFAESLSFQTEEHLAKRMSDNRKVLERLRVGLGRFVQEGPVVSFSRMPLRRAMRS